MVLNTIVAEAFDRISAELEKLPKKEFHSGLQKILHGIVKKHKRIIFNGDGYTDNWLAEAKRRGLPNARSTMEALKALTVPANIALFEKYGVYNARELESRYGVGEENYHRKIHIEGEIALEMACSMIFPAVADEFGKISRSLAAAKSAGLKSGVKALSANAAEIGRLLDDLEKRIEALRKALGGLHEEILAAMDDLRKTVDALEKIVPDESWPLPKYREMLFVY